MKLIAPSNVPKTFAPSKPSLSVILYSALNLFSYFSLNLISLISSKEGVFSFIALYSLEDDDDDSIGGISKIILQIFPVLYQIDVILKVFVSALTMAL